MSDSTIKVVARVPETWWNKFRMEYRTVSISAWLTQHLKDFIRWDPADIEDKRWPAYIYKAELRRLGRLKRDPFRFAWPCGGRFDSMQPRKQATFQIEPWLVRRAEPLLQMLGMNISELIRDVLEDATLRPKTLIKKQMKWEEKYRDRNILWKKKRRKQKESTESPQKSINPVEWCGSHNRAKDSGRTYRGDKCCPQCVSEMEAFFAERGMRWVD